MRAPKSKRPKAAVMLKAIHAMESCKVVETKALAVADELDSMRPKNDAKVVRDGYEDTLIYTRSYTGTGDVCAPTTLSSDSTVRSSAGRGSWVPSLTGGRSSCSSPRG